MPTCMYFMLELNASPAASDRPAPPFHPIAASRSAASSGVGQRDDHRCRRGLHRRRRRRLAVSQVATSMGRRRQSGPSAHKVLGVAPGASSDEIRAAWKKMALATHPDKLVDDDEGKAFKAVREAYETLSKMGPQTAPASSSSTAGKTTRWGGTRHEGDESASSSYNPINAANRQRRHEQYMARMRAWAEEEKQRQQAYESWSRPAEAQAKRDEDRYRARLDKIQEERKRKIQEEMEKIQERRRSEAEARAGAAGEKSAAAHHPTGDHEPSDASAAATATASANATRRRPEQQQPQARQRKAQQQPPSQQPQRPPPQRPQRARWQPRGTPVKIEPAPLPRPRAASSAAASTASAATHAGRGPTDRGSDAADRAKADGAHNASSVPRAVRAARSRAGTSSLNALFQKLDAMAATSSEGAAPSSAPPTDAADAAEADATAANATVNDATIANAADADAAGSNAANANAADAKVADAKVADAKVADADGQSASEKAARYYSTRWHGQYHTDAACRRLVGALSILRPIIETVTAPDGLAPCSECAGVLGVSNAIVGIGKETSECLEVESEPEPEPERPPRAKWVFEPCAVEPSCAQELQADLRELRRMWGADLDETRTDSDRSSPSLESIEA